MGWQWLGHEQGLRRLARRPVVDEVNEHVGPETHDARQVVGSDTLRELEVDARGRSDRTRGVFDAHDAAVLVHRDEPTLIEFWNLQGDDDHDFMLMDPQWSVMMKVVLPALKKTTYIFTFHEEGLFNFSCVVHQPAMNGQILILPPVRPPSR